MPSEKEYQQMLQNNPELGVTDDGRGRSGTRLPTQATGKGQNESAAQIIFFQWVNALVPERPEYAYVFHPPNGGARHKATGGRMKAEGVRRGVPDIWWPVARGGYVGLVIEMKVGKNMPTQEQLDWLDFLAVHGWCCHVAYGAQDAWGFFQTYDQLEDGEKHEGSDW